MDVVLWIIAGVLAIAFLAAGLTKAIQSTETLMNQGLDWVEDFSPLVVKAIGVLEVLAAIGLILPAVLGTAQILVPLAALGLALLMIGAIITHVRRAGETPMIVINVLLLVLAAIVAWGRFGPYSFT